MSNEQTKIIQEWEALRAQIREHGAKAVHHAKLARDLSGDAEKLLRSYAVRLAESFNVTKGLVYERDDKRTIVAVEVQPKRAAALRRFASVEVVECDFLALRPSQVFDTVLMNPPFAVQGSALAYVDHIEHAMKFLAPGGVLVSVVPAGYRFRTDGKIARLRAAISQHEHIIEEFGSDAAGMKTGVYMLVVGMRKA